MSIGQYATMTSSNPERGRRERTGALETNALQAGSAYDGTPTLFIRGSRLGVSGADVLAATEAVMACFEIVEGRIRDFKCEVQNAVADNASAARLQDLGSVSTRFVP